jgi:hypothetical protein
MVTARILGAPSLAPQPFLMGCCSRRDAPFLDNLFVCSFCFVLPQKERQVTHTHNTVLETKQQQQQQQQHLSPAGRESQVISHTMMNMDVTTTTTTTRRPKRLSCHDDDNNNKISVVGHRRRCHGHRRPIMATATTLLFSMMMMTTTTTTTTILLLLSHLMVVTAFTPLPLPPPLLRRTCSWRRRHSSSSSSSSSTTTSSNTWPLHGIAEWRDKTFDFPGNDRSSSRPLGGKPSDETQALPMLLKEICILPFPFFEVLLQGETKQLRLYEERFLQLFEYCMEHHHGVVAMGLLASGDDNNTGIIQTVPLCEMEAYHRMERFGIFVTIRVVGRAQLHEIMQQQQQQSPPYIKAVCRELHDQIPPNLELPNLLAGTIENYLMLLSKMEAQLVQAAPPPPKANVTNETDTTDDDDDEDEDDSAMAREMKRRIEVAKLVCIYQLEFILLCHRHRLPIHISISHQHNIPLSTNRTIAFTMTTWTMMMTRMTTNY